MLNYGFVLLLFYLNFISCEQKDSDELLSVIVIFRHGDRTPLFPYPKDPYNDEKYWPEGYCQLTPLGKEQCFGLGKWLRKRYNKFLPSIYNPKDIHFRSTNRDRTLLSGAYLAAGLYQTDVKKPWTLVPIHTRPILSDNLLLMRSRCPRYDYLRRQVLQQSPFIECHRKNQKLFKFLSEKTGFNVTTIDDVFKIYDTLKIEKRRNLKLPRWGVELYPLLKNLSLLSLSAEVKNESMARLKPGLLLRWIIRHFEHVLMDKSLTMTMDFYDTDYRVQKFIVFCAHDHVIVNILQTFGLFDMNWPHVASALIFEYRETENFEKYVNLYYKNSIFVAVELELPQCTFNCPFEQFKTILGPYAIDQETWVKECRWNPVPSNSTSS